MQNSTFGWSTIKDLGRMARPDHWFKNVFVLPGFFFATEFYHVGVFEKALTFLIGMAATCIVASANYILNEWLDRAFDQHHPVKKMRPSVSGRVQGYQVWCAYVLFISAGLGLSLLVSMRFFYAESLLLIMGFAYNVSPLRTKDRPYLDTLSESINNPIRFVLGWYIVSAQVFPPSSVLLTYWFGGAFLMQIKRYSEYRFINDPTAAALYRRSFAFYDEGKLLNASIFYAVMSAILGGIFLVKYKIELILVTPFIAVMYAWYFSIGLKKNSAAQHPENMAQERAFLTFVVFVCVAAVALIKFHIPALRILAEAISP